MVSLQATCLVKSDIGLILRGQGPAEQVQACLLLKISGSHSCKYISVNSFTDSNH